MSKCPAPSMTGAQDAGDGAVGTALPARKMSRKNCVYKCGLWLEALGSG